MAPMTRGEAFDWLSSLLSSSSYKHFGFSGLPRVCWVASACKWANTKKANKNITRSISRWEFHIKTDNWRIGQLFLNTLNPSNPLIRQVKLQFSAVSYRAGPIVDGKATKFHVKPRKIIKRINIKKYSKEANACVTARTKKYWSSQLPMIEKRALSNPRHSDDMLHMNTTRLDNGLEMLIWYMLQSSL